MSQKVFWDKTQNSILKKKIWDKFKENHLNMFEQNILIRMNERSNGLYLPFELSYMFKPYIQDWLAILLVLDTFEQIYMKNHSNKKYIIIKQ